MNTAPFLWLALVALPLVSQAQSDTVTTPNPRRRGELIGARPVGGMVVRPRAQVPPRHPMLPTFISPTQNHLLNSQVNVAQVRASELPDLYEQFIATTREERRSWSYVQWDAASQVLARLNQRYEQVRTGLPLEERLRVRSFQGEFHTLRGARQVKNKFE